MGVKSIAYNFPSQSRTDLRPVPEIYQQFPSAANDLKAGKMVA